MPFAFRSEVPSAKPSKSSTTNLSCAVKVVFEINNSKKNKIVFEAAKKYRSAASLLECVHFLFLRQGERKSPQARDKQQRNKTKKK